MQLLKEGQKMKIIDFFKSHRQEYWFNEIGKCTPDFHEVSALTHYIEGRNFHYHMGKGTVLLLTDGDRLVSFLSFFAQVFCHR